MFIVAYLLIENMKCGAGWTVIGTQSFSLPWRRPYVTCYLISRQIIGTRSLSKNLISSGRCWHEFRNNCQLSEIADVSQSVQSRKNPLDRHGTRDRRPFSLFIQASSQRLAIIQSNADGSCIQSGPPGRVPNAENYGSLIGESHPYGRRIC